MTLRNRSYGRTRAILACALGMALLLAGAMAWFATAQVGQRPPSAGTAPRLLADDLQRSRRLDTYSIVADSGPARGETIYFYKCWMCHNKYAKSAPYLKDLYQRRNLVSGEAVSDATVAAKIQAGGAGMPAFRTSMSDADVADVIAYIRSGQCCVEGENPPVNPWYRAEKNKWQVPSGLTGGATGSVRIASGDSPEGIGVMLVAPNGVRTTVYTNGDGKFEFPAMQTGQYTLRIATPVPFKPYRRDAVSVSGAANLGEIVLERVAASDNLPVTPELWSQLSSAEQMWNIPGTAEEKAALQRYCSGCHSWQQIFRNRYDEHGWRLILDRMMHHQGTAIAIRNRALADADADFKLLLSWLTRVRGPDAQDGPVRVFPRPRGLSTRVVVTEYELPRELLALHDAAMDNEGNIWYTSHKTRYVGRLDPKTGVVKEYTLPLTPEIMPGTHHAKVDKNGIVYISENWAHQLNRLDPKTGEVHQVRIESTVPLNAPSFGNFTLDQEGFVWDARANRVTKRDPVTGKILKEWPLQTTQSYDNLISYDGKYWAGSGPANWGNTMERLEIETGKWINVNTGARMATAKRGGFDPFGDPWFGGGGGSLMRLNAKAGRIEEYFPPIAPHPYTDFYEAMPDKNGEVWAGVLHGRQMLRLDPKTESWRVYQLPEPFAYNRRTVIDASTNPVTVWYVDYNNYLVRVQPLD